MKIQQEGKWKKKEMEIYNNRKYKNVEHDNIQTTYISEINHFMFFNA